MAQLAGVAGILCRIAQGPESSTDGGSWVSQMGPGTKEEGARPGRWAPHPGHWP